MHAALQADCSSSCYVSVVCICVCLQSPPGLLLSAAEQADMHDIASTRLHPDVKHMSAVNDCILMPALATGADASHDRSVKLRHTETDSMFTHELSTKADVLPVSVVLMRS